MMPKIIEVKNLEKYFYAYRPLYQRFVAPFAAKPKIMALEKISFTVETGEILGVVGPNGAGKTTLLRILADLLDADGGWVKLCGQELIRSKCYLRCLVGYVSSDERSFFWRLTGRQNLEFFSRLYCLPERKTQKRVAEMLARFGLEEKADQLFRDYSTGTRKKFAFIRGLIHEPQIVLLDELTNSLDPPSSESIKSIVRKYILSGSDRAGLWSTHRLEEVYEICDKVLVINEGRIEYFGSVAQLPNDDSDRFTNTRSNAKSNCQAINSIRQ